MESLTDKENRYLRFKRIHSFIGAIILIPLLIPLFVIVLLINLIATKGHPFYKQQRYGYQRKIFYIYKFRSMDDSGKSNFWGRFIRFTSIDELLQIFNILKGDMNFVGPRPLSIKEEDMDILRKDSNPSPYLVRPGLTGYAQIRFNHLEDKNIKINHDVYYVEHMSLLFDLKIIVLTIFKLVPITIHHKK